MIIFLHRQQKHHLELILPSLRVDYVLDEDWSAAKLQELHPAILVAFSDDWHETYDCIRKARELQIPTLLLMDGILEWRHQWENPRWGEGGGVPYKQPVQCDKVACIGRQSARTLESWGNLGKCEVVGVPRFDRLSALPKSVPSGDVRRVLVMTAHTPGFTPEQLEITLRSLADVRDVLQAMPGVEVVWRVTRGLHERLGVANRLDDWGGRDLPEILQQCDAVITTPTTAMLEAMLMDRPVALLDYHNTPRYVPAAWNIYCREHIAGIVGEMFTRPARKLAFQDDILHDCLECRTSATPRMVALIEAMADVGRRRKFGETAAIPQRVLEPGPIVPSGYLDMARLYPGHPVLDNPSLDLQVELIHCRQALAQARAQLAERGAGYWLQRGMHAVRRKIGSR